MGDQQNIQEWIAQARQSGLSDKEIANQLLGAGWSEAQVASVLGSTRTSTEQENQRREEERINQIMDNTQGSSPVTAQGGKMPGVFQLMRLAWKITMDRIGAFFAIILVTIVLGGIAGGLLFLLGTLGFGFAAFGLSKSIADVSLWAVFTVLILYWLISSLVFSWMQAAVILSITNQSGSIGSILKHSFKLMFAYWWITLLVSFFVGGASMLLGVPGIVFGVWFFFGIYVLMAENVRGMQALLRSKEYVRGYWWAVLGRHIAFTILISLFFLLLNLVLGWIGSETILLIIDFVLVVLLLPFTLAFYYSQFQSLQRIKGSQFQTPQKKAGIIITAVVGWLFIPLMFTFIGGFAVKGARSIADDAERKSDVTQLRTALYLYYDDNFSYPVSLDDLEPEYLAQELRDPKTDEPYDYSRLNNGKDFEICATLSEKDVTGSSEYCLDSL